MERIDRFQQLKSFVLFYGSGNEENLSNFDLAIVEPKGHSEETLLPLRAAGTLILGYFSLVEINPQEDEFTLLKREDFIFTDGSPRINLDFGNYLVDPRSERWKKILRYRAGKLLTQMDYDGLFFDTLGDLEYLNLSPEEESIFMIAGSNLVRELRIMYPEHIFIQNNGLEKFARLTGPYLNGFCWENPPIGEIRNRNLVNNILNQQKCFADSRGIKLLLLFEAKSCSEITKASVRAYLKQIKLDSEDFLIYVSPPGYCSGINT